MTMPDEKNIDVDVVDEEKKEDFEDICFLCRRPESKVGKMVHLPNDIHICQNCMQKVFDSMGKGGMNFQDMSNMPNISMINLSDLQDHIPQKQKIRKKKSKEEAEKKALYYLEKVGMAPYINAKPKQLSGGQKQRVAIARALAMEPEILLFDEPTSALDPQMVGEVLEVMRDLAHDGLTMIIVTHEMAFARDVSKRVIFMANGVIVEDRPPKELFENPKDPLTKDFLSRFRNA